MKFVFFRGTFNGTCIGKFPTRDCWNIERLLRRMPSAFYTSLLTFASRVVQRVSITFHDVRGHVRGLPYKVWKKSDEEGGSKREGGSSYRESRLKMEENGRKSATVGIHEPRGRVRKRKKRGREFVGSTNRNVRRYQSFVSRYLALIDVQVRTNRTRLSLSLSLSLGIPPSGNEPLSDWCSRDCVQWTTTVGK